MADAPLVTIAIPVWRRLADSLAAAESAHQQTYRPIEVLVLDASPEGKIGRAICAMHPATRVIHIEKNLGATGARNLLTREAQGRYVLHLDDDATAPPQLLEKAVPVLEAHPNAAIFALELLADGAPSPDAIPLAAREVTSFVACCIMRKDAVCEVGLYPELLVIRVEETHLALRLLDRGYGIVAVPGLGIHHYPSSIGRSKSYHVYRQTRNELLTILELLPRWAVLPVFALKVLKLGWFGLRWRRPHSMVAGVFAALWHAPRLLCKGPRIRWATYRRVTG